MMAWHMPILKPRSSRRALVGAAGATSLFLASVGLSGQDAAGRDPQVEAAVAYVAGYTKAMASVVCDERQVQRVLKHDGKVSKQRELISEVLLVDTGGNGPFSLVVFRDVAQVDGKNVRNRDDRLRRLLMEPQKKAFDQAVRITKEGARYNIGAFDRETGNVDPLVQAIWWFGGDLGAGRFTRTADGVSFSRGTRRAKTGRGDSGQLAIQGRYVLDSDGRIAESHWATDDPTFDIRITVRYHAHPKLDVLVPAEMQRHERVAQKANADTTEARVTYSNCRQFQVTTEESIQLPKP